MRGFSVRHEGHKKRQKQISKHQHPSSTHAIHQTKVAAASLLPKKGSLRIYTCMLHVASTQHHMYPISSAKTSVNED
eukprot:1704837-Ditylum_brightwellii.AAC.1